MQLGYRTKVCHVVVSPLDKQVEGLFLIKRENGRKRREEWRGMKT